MTTDISLNPPDIFRMPSNSKPIIFGVKPLHAYNPNPCREIFPIVSRLGDAKLFTSHRSRNWIKPGPMKSVCGSLAGMNLRSRRIRSWKPSGELIQPQKSSMESLSLQKSGVSKERFGWKIAREWRDEEWELGKWEPWMDGKAYWGAKEHGSKGCEPGGNLHRPARLPWSDTLQSEQTQVSYIVIQSGIHLGLRGHIFVYTVIIVYLPSRGKDATCLDESVEIVESGETRGCTCIISF